MPQHDHTDSRVRAPESDFYLPAGVAPPFDASQFERIWATLFNHQVEPPN